MRTDHALELFSTKLRDFGLGAGTEAIPVRNRNGWQGCCQPLRFYERNRRLVMSAAASIATAGTVVTVPAPVEAISAVSAVEMVPATPVEEISTMSAVKMAVAAPVATSTIERPAAALLAGKIPTIVPEAVAVTVSPAVRTFKAVAVAPVAVAIPVTAIPRADSDEHAAHKILGPVITVGRAVVRVIIIVAVGACRRRNVNPFGVHGTNPDPDSDRHLGLSVARRKQENSQQSDVL
jgi:hypothetical protein